MIFVIGIREAREIASRTGWLAHTTPSFSKAVLEQTQLQRFSQREAIYSIGDPPGGMYCLISGTLLVAIAPHDAGPHLIHIFSPGTWTGQAPLIAGGPRMIGVRCARDSVLLHLPLYAMQEILRKDPEAWRFVAMLTLMHMQQALSIIDDLLIRDHAKRLIAIILRLGNCRKGARPNGEIHAVDLNHEDLASMSNLARTTVSATLHELETQGLIELAYRRIVVLRPDRLNAMLGG